jgi:ribosome-binding factor A
MKLKPRSVRQMRMEKELRRILCMAFTELGGDLAKITINDVDVSPDYRQGTVLMRSLYFDEDKCVKIIAEHTHGINSYLSINLSSKNTPKLKYRWDFTYEKAEVIRDLLKDYE